MIDQSDQIAAFSDVNPQADIHILIVPKKHIGTFLELKTDAILAEMIVIAQKLIKDNGLNRSGYRLLFNGGKYQHVSHLHWHLLGGQIKNMP